MTPFLARVMELRNLEQMAVAMYESEAQRCRVCGVAYRNLRKPVCGPCARKQATLETQTQDVRQPT